MAKRKATQDWSPGKLIQLGPPNARRTYRVLHRETDAPKGMPRAFVLETPDGSRQYRWLGHRGGLQLVNCELIRPRVRYTKDNPYRGPKGKPTAKGRAPRRAATPPRPPAPAPGLPLPAFTAPTPGVFRGLLARLGLRRKPPGN
jgi:hypothetical protein